MGAGPLVRLLVRIQGRPGGRNIWRQTEGPLRARDLGHVGVLFLLLVAWGIDGILPCPLCESYSWDPRSCTQDLVRRDPVVGEEYISIGVCAPSFLFCYVSLWLF